MRQAERKQAEVVSDAPPSAPSESTPPADWTSGPPTASELRSRVRVASELATVHMSPDDLPEEPAATAGLLDLVGPIARRALDLGLAAREPSFHVFVAAGQDVGIEDEIVRYAERFLRVHGEQGSSTPPDLVYVHDFQHPEAPRPLVLPAGAGARLSTAMEGCLEALRDEIAKVGELEPVKEAQAELAKELETKNREVLTGLEVTAKTLGFGVRTIQGGVQTFPILHGKPLSAEQFEALDESTKKALSQSEEHLSREVEKSASLVRETSERYQEAQTRALAVAARAVIRETMEPLFEEFSPLGEDVVAWLEQVQQALIEDWADFVREDEDEKNADSGADADPEHAVRLGRFRVNLLVTYEPGTPAAVIYDTNPTYPHLFGYLERRARFGALLTDFTRIRAGSLQRASGGVLIVRAADVLADPIIWERLKRVMRERRIGAEDPLGPLGLYATSLRPVPVPVRVRVVLVGTQDLYAALLESDADFASLFRVKVEIEPSIPRVAQTLISLDAHLMAKAHEREWGRFDRAARARLLDLSTRMSGHKDKLSIGMSPLEETMAFASAIAAARALAPPPSADGKPPEGAPSFRASVAPPSTSLVTAADIDLAWRERRDRAGAAERAIRELTLRGEVALDTDGSRVGVVNGLSVFSAGDVEFGQPMRITAVVALGREGIIDVEREAQLGGSIHTKGIAILRGYLGRMFGQERPLSLRAQLAIEQSYGEVDGDSASSSELFAVLSSLAELPIDQGIAVTGSVNQLGEMQAIGGLCAKIEGYFDLCTARGLTGRQGVMLPRSNVQHLLLRGDVAAAIADNRFHLYAVADVANGIELLTGVPAGERDASGHFPASSVFARVERRLIEIAERLREAESHVHHEGPPEPDVSSPELPDASDFRVR